MANLVDEFFNMGTFTDDYFKNVIEPYKQGLRPRPSFSEAIRYARPLKAFMPQALGGTFYTKPTPMVMNFLRGLGQGALRGAGIFSLFVPSRELGSGELTPEIIEQEVRAQNAAEAQESRNQSRDDYTGGGGTVVIGKGGGETKTVSPRSREAMYAAPTRTPEPPPFRRFNTGGVVGLFRRF